MSERTLVTKGPLVDINELQHYLECGMNVLFEGKHGIGKTHIVLDAFKRANLESMYLSGSTLDPWVDVVGVPRILEDERTGTCYTKVIPPERFAFDTVDAIFIDELNRAPKKVRNAVLELIQFKTINGQKLSRLKVVWAAINPFDPENTEYDVEQLDPALQDRFHVHLNLDYRPCPEYMTATYGKAVAHPAIKWWEEMPDKIRDMVSPRRLCYAIDYWQKSGDVRKILPLQSNPEKLIESLGEAPILVKLKTFYDANDVEGAREWLKDENNYNAVKLHIAVSNTGGPFFVPLLSPERRQALLFEAEGGLIKIMVRHCEKIPEFQQTLHTLLEQRGNQEMASRAETLIARQNLTHLFEDVLGEKKGS